jgi:hypothetical protein
MRHFEDNGLRKLPSNNAFQPTPLCGLKIAAILKPKSSSTALPIYRRGAAECWPLGRNLSQMVPRVYQFSALLNLRP